LFHMIPQPYHLRKKGFRLRKPAFFWLRCQRNKANRLPIGKYFFHIFFQIRIIMELVVTALSSIGAGIGNVFSAVTPCYIIAFIVHILDESLLAGAVCQGFLNGFYELKLPALLPYCRLIFFRFHRLLLWFTPIVF